MPRKLANYGIVACAVAVLAVGWLVVRGKHSQATGQPPEATRHSFQDLRSGSLARPASTDSPDLEAWLTTTRDGLLHQRSTLARQKVSPSTVVFDAVISVETKPGVAGQRGPSGRLAEAGRGLGQPEAWPGVDSNFRRAGMLAGAWSIPVHDLALGGASGEPAGRRLCRLALDMAPGPAR